MKRWSVPDFMSLDKWNRFQLLLNVHEPTNVTVKWLRGRCRAFTQIDLPRWRWQWSFGFVRALFFSLHPVVC